MIVKMLSIIYLMFQHFYWCGNASNSFDIEQTFTLYQKKFWTTYSLHLLAAQPRNTCHEAFVAVFVLMLKPEEGLNSAAHWRLLCVGTQLPSSEFYVVCCSLAVLLLIHFAMIWLTVSHGISAWEEISQTDLHYY